MGPILIKKKEEKISKHGSIFVTEAKIPSIHLWFSKFC